MINGRLAAAISCYWRTRTKVLVLLQNSNIKINSNNIRSLCFYSSRISITSATRSTAIATRSATATTATASGLLVARMTKTSRKSIQAVTTTSTKTITKRRRMTTSTGSTQTTIRATTATINSNNVNSITSENHFVVSLEKNDTRMTIQLPSSSSTVVATPSNMPFEEASAAPTVERAAVEESKQIPETVIQYERQLRKIQAASRASTPLCTSQLHRSIIYNDESMVVVNKPSGVLTVPGIHSNPSILTMLYDLFQHEMDPTTMTKKENMIVHRLDMDTSGIVVFAKTREAMSKLQSYFRDKKVSKTYEALLCGHLHDTVQEGVISLPLQKDHRFPPFMRVATPKSERDAKQVVKDLNHAGWKKIIMKNPKPSETIFQVIGREYVASSSSSTTTTATTTETEKQYPVTRVRLIPVTGRTHQLRVHCAAMGHPILGDPTYGIYGEASPNGGFEDDVMDRLLARTSRATVDLQLSLDKYVKEQGLVMCLHARELRLAHPQSGEEMHFMQPPDF